MKVEELAIPGLRLITPTLFHDERGFFLETYHQKHYASLGISSVFVQDNCSFSKKGTLRGMHFQAEPGQAKLVSVTQGHIFDVAVDIRPHSPTYRKWVGVHLNSQTREQLFIPEGCAHGFCVLSEEACVVYKVSQFYDPKEERSFHYGDPAIGIEWPVRDPILSQKDRSALSLNEVI